MSDAKRPAEFAPLFHHANAAAAADNKKPKPSELNAQQQRALDLVLSGQSIFLTGGAGTGKSYTLKRIVKALQDAHGEDSVFITASTGIAACHIGGTTLHSFAGVGLAKGKLPALVDKVKQNRSSIRRWRDCHVLVIDEVSMLDGGFFDTLEAIARSVLQPGSPELAPAFGGIQLVLCGDFFQLPPVGLGQNPQLKFMFEAAAWARTVAHTVVLEEVFRQSDSGFVTILNEMRRAQLSQFSLALLRGAMENPPQLGPSTTKLFAHNEAADRENDRRLAELPTETKEYEAYDADKPQARSLRENCIAPTLLRLRLGARVMMLKNATLEGAQVVNGMCGTVVGFETKAADAGKSVLRAPTAFGDRRAAPAPSTTAFQDQFGEEPMGAEAALVPERRPGEAAYVAAARQAAARQADPARSAVAELFEWPVVEFTSPASGEPFRRCVVPEEWTLEQGGSVVARRVQVPLKLAWAISIHKSQGMTLDAVELDLARCFDEGHAYVALSRAVSLRKTRLNTFDPRRVRANARVIRFYESMQQQQQPAPPGSSVHAQGGGQQPLRAVAGNGAPGLSQEQLALIEEKKKQALARRLKAQASSAAGPS